MHRSITNALSFKDGIRQAGEKAMHERDLWVIEPRTEDGHLDFIIPDPSDVFGKKSITGITSDEMAKVIFRQIPDAVLEGAKISTWPRLINPRWIARRKTW
jgi:hypothetical protein